MINALLTRVAGFLEKDFLFASFLPALLFAASVVTTLALVVGLESAWALMASLSPLQKAASSAAATVVLIVFAYVLNALRSAFAQFWTGRSAFPLYLLWGPQQLLIARKRRKFLKLRVKAEGESPLPAVLEKFQDDVQEAYDDKTLPAPSAAELKGLMAQVKSLGRSEGESAVAGKLAAIAGAYGSYSGKELAPVLKGVKRTLLDWIEEETSEIQTAAYELDRGFGTLVTIRPTKLGNIVESYNQYPAKRYCIEAEIFWPRLRSVIRPEYFAAVEDPRILMDFSLTMATLGLAYALAALFVGPWLLPNLTLWLALAAAGVFVAWFFYRLSVRAALQLGEMVRSSFDLFRLSLLEALGLPHPVDFRHEQKLWQEFSRLAVYGVGMQFYIRARST